MERGGTTAGRRVIDFATLVAVALAMVVMVARPGLCADPSATPSSTASPSASSSPRFLFSNVSSTVKLAPVLRLTLSAPQIDVLPRDNGTVVPVPLLSVRLGRVAQVNAGGDAVTLSATLINGSWSRLSNNSLNATQSFVYAGHLAFPNGTVLHASEPATLRFQLYVFNRPTNVTLDRLLSYKVLPAYAKFTLSVTNWPWLDAQDNTDDRLQLRVRIGPPFNGSVQYSNESDGLVQTFTLTGQALPPFIEKLLNGRKLVRRIRLVDAVEIDGELIKSNRSALLGAERSKVEFVLNSNTSELVLSFGRFNSTLVYDPDFGVLLEGKENGDGGVGGDDDNTALIVATSVVLPIALLIVVVVAVAIVVLTYRRRERFATVAVQSASSINFSSGDL